MSGVDDVQVRVLGPPDDTVRGAGDRADTVSESSLLPGHELVSVVNRPGAGRAVT
ncbi:hypothetical protein ACWCPQ_24940 [Nocardia sp. NPDC001965]